MSLLRRESCSGRAGAGDTKAGDPLSRASWSTSSVSRVLFHPGVALEVAAVIPLGRPLPDASSSLPADSSESPSTAPLFRGEPHVRLCGLAPDGVCLAASVTGGAVGSYPAVSPLPAAPLRFRRDEAGGLFSVALSFAFPRPGVTRHRALWSSDFPPAALLALSGLGSRPAIACSASTGRKVTPLHSLRNGAHVYPRGE